jgi:hypothetical protein
MPVTRADVRQAVIEATKPHENKRYSVRDPIRLGKGRFYIVTFEGEKEEFFVHFVYEDPSGNLEVYQDVASLIHERASHPPSEHRPLIWAFALSSCCLHLHSHLLSRAAAPSPKTSFLLS